MNIKHEFAPTDKSGVAHSLGAQEANPGPFSVDFAFSIGLLPLIFFCTFGYPDNPFLVKLFFYHLSDILKFFPSGAIFSISPNPCGTA